MKFEPVAILAAVLMLTACGKPQGASDQTAATTPPGHAASPPSAPAAPSADNLLGRWKGPEGLFLDIRARDPASGLYPITLKDNLDTQAEYKAQATAGGFSFVRAGKPVKARVGIGPETGFKDLFSKRDCLILEVGSEGYCRD